MSKMMTVVISAKKASGSSSHLWAIFHDEASMRGLLSYFSLRQKQCEWAWKCRIARKQHRLQLNWMLLRGPSQGQVWPTGRPCAAHGRSGPPESGAWPAGVLHGSHAAGCCLQVSKQPPGCPTQQLVASAPSPASRCQLDLSDS